MSGDHENVQMVELDPLSMVENRLAGIEHDMGILLRLFQNQLKEERARNEALLDRLIAMKMIDTGHPELAAQMTQAAAQLRREPVVENEEDPDAEEDWAGGGERVKLTH